MIVSTHGILKPLDSFPNLYSDNFGGTNEFVDVPDNAALKPVNFSFGCWAKMPTPGAVSTLFGKRLNVGGNPSYHMYWDTGNSRIHCAFRDTATAYHDLDSLGFVANTWQHWMGCYNGVTFKFYLNAVEQSTKNVNTAVAYSTTYATQFGGFSGLFPLTGRLYHPCFYNAGLDAAGVAAVHAAKGGDLRLIANSANLVSAWYFPTGQAGYPTMVDYVSGLDGTMNNQENTDIDSDIPV